jgi:FAD/FMN-containing dehydrogenase
MRVVNGAKYHLARREHGHGFLQSHVGFAFLLDYIPEWKRALGPGGLIQYQSFIPAARAGEVFSRQLRLAQEAGLVPYLGVLKRHRPDFFVMTHALDGFSLALEFKVTARNRRRLWGLAAAFDEIVIGAGGRFYFAKDSTLSRTRLGSLMAEERVQHFLDLKRRFDPEGLLQTNLYRRLFDARSALGTSPRLTSSSARIAASTS